MKVCFKCGKRECETCCGSGLTDDGPDTELRDCPVPDCKDGWREPSLVYCSFFDRIGCDCRRENDEQCKTCENGYGVRRGKDPADLCPPCREGA